MSGIYKEILKKIKKLEFNTDVGRVNFVVIIVISVVMAGLKIFSYVNSWLNSAIFHQGDKSHDLFKYFLLLAIVFILSVLSVLIGEKEKNS